MKKLYILLVIAVAALIVAPVPTLASVCTLADHIKSANTNTAVGFCPAGTSHDVITITEDITLTEPLPPITSTITIEGGGHTISGKKEFRIFEVGGGRLTINNLTLTSGRADTIGGRGGGGLGKGGAVWAHSGAELIVNHSVLSRNQSHFSGGAISVSQSKLTVNNSSFFDNTVGHNGGAIAIQRGTIEISNSSFLANEALAYDGGAIYVAAIVTGTITNSTFYANRALRGGAVATNLGEYRPNMTLTHVTMVNNQAEEGLSVWIDRKVGDFILRNSLLAGIDDRYQYRKERPRICQGPLSENSGNFIEDGSCASMAGDDPMLGEITGSPAYFSLLNGSPALDAADARYCTETDQLGTPRPLGAGCDIGAIESTTAVPVPTPIPGICPLPDQIIAANTDRAVGSCPAGNGADIIEMIRDFTLEARSCRRSPATSR